MHEGAPKVENNLEKPLIKEGVDFVFTKNPELQEIGTKEQYSEYLDTIFPESSIHEIFYRGDTTKFSLPTDNNIGVYLATNKSYALQYGDRVTIAVIETKNPYYTSDMPGMYWKRVIDKSDRLSIHDSIILNSGDEFIVAPKQVHILGTKSDLEKFKEFVG